MRKFLKSKKTKGTINLILNPDLILEFKEICHRLGFKEQPKQKELFEKALEVFIKENK